MSNAGSTVQYTDVRPNDNRYGTVVQIIGNSFLDPVYHPTWVIHSLKTVKNLKLFQQYKAKSEELRQAGRDVREYDMFTCYKTMDLIRNILEHGLQTRQSSFNFLGDSQRGVNLCKHADIQLKAAENTGQEECYLIIYKVMLGKALRVYPSPDNHQLAPTEDFDSHISSLNVDRTIPLGQQAIRSQVFCYEYTNGQLSSCPRHVLPYVVVCYKRTARPATIPPALSMPMHNQRPVIQPPPPPPPLVQMAPAPKPPTYYNHQPGNDISGMPDFQPRMPPRNPFTAPPMSAIQPLPSYQADPTIQFPGMRMPAMSHGPPNVNLAAVSGGMMLPSVPRTMDQHATGMRLPYITPQPPPPVVEQQHRIVFSQPNQPHMPPNVSMPNLHQHSNHHRFSMFMNPAPRPPRPIVATGMSIPLQVPTTAPPCIPVTATNGTPHVQKENMENIGMRLPIVIQPEGPTPEETILEQEQRRIHNSHMRLPTITTPEPVLSISSSAAMNGHRSASPPDIKPDISKIDLRPSNRKLLRYEEIQIDQEEDVPDTASVTSHNSATLANPLVIAPTDMADDNPELVAALDLTSNRKSTHVTSETSSPLADTVADNLGATNEMPVDEAARTTITPAESDDSLPTCDATNEIARQGSDDVAKGDATQLPSTPREELAAEKINRSVVAKTQGSIHHSSPCPEADARSDLDDDTLPDLPLCDSAPPASKAGSKTLADISAASEISELSTDVIHDDDISVGYIDVVDLPQKVANKPTKRKQGDDAKSSIKPKPKKKRKRDPFLVPKRKKYKGGRKPLKETTAPNNIFYSSLQEPCLQKNPVFKICQDGCIEMFYDIYEEPKDGGKSHEANISKSGPPRTLIIIDEGLSKLDLGDMWNEMKDDSVDIELTSHKKHKLLLPNSGVFAADNNDLTKPNEECTVPNAVDITGESCSLDEDIYHDFSFNQPHTADIVDSAEFGAQSPDTKLSEESSDWKIVVKDQRFQPKVVVKDVRSTTEWNAFISKDQMALSNDESEDDGGMTLQITSVHSLQDTNTSDVHDTAASTIAKHSHTIYVDENVSANSQEGSICGIDNTEHGLSKDPSRIPNCVNNISEDGVRIRRPRKAKQLANTKPSAYIHDDGEEKEDMKGVQDNSSGDTSNSSCDDFVRTRKSRKAKDHLKSSAYVNDDCDEVKIKRKKKSRIKSKAIVDCESSSASDIEQTGEPETNEIRENNSCQNKHMKDTITSNKTSFDNLLQEKSKLEEELRKLEDEENPSVTNSPPRSVSPVIDIANLESMGTQSLLRDLSENQNTEKKDLVLYRLSQVRNELKNKNNTPKSENRSTLDLFLGNDPLRSDEESSRKEKPRSKVDQSCSDFAQNGYRKRDDTESESEDSVSRTSRSSPTRDNKSSYSSKSNQSRASEKGQSSYDDNNSRKAGICKVSPSRDRKYYRSSRRHRESPDRYRHTNRNRRREDSYSRRSKRDSYSPSRRHRTGDRSSGRHRSSRERSLEHRVHGKSFEKEKGVSTRKEDMPADKHSSQVIPEKKTKDEKESEHVCENEPPRDSEDWLKTCDYLFGASVKKEQPLYDAFSSGTDSVACADPKKWLTALIRMNTQKKNPSSSTTQKEESTKSVVSNIDNVATKDVATIPAERGGLAASTLCVTSKTTGTNSSKTSSSSSTEGNTPSKPAVPSTNFKEGSVVQNTNELKADTGSLSQQQVTALVSKVLTIFKPNETPLSSPHATNTTPHSQTLSGGNSHLTPRSSEISSDVRMDNEGEFQQSRLASRYPRRKRRSGPITERDDSVGSSRQPTLWGSQATGTPIVNQSLEEMHQEVQFQEPQVETNTRSEYNQPTIVIPNLASTNVHNQPVSPRCGTFQQTMLSPAQQTASGKFDANASVPRQMPPPPIPTLPPLLEPSLNVDAIQAKAVAVLTLCAVTSAMQNSAVGTSPTSSSDYLPHTRDPRRRRPSMSPRTESGSDMETHLRSPLFSESPVLESNAPAFETEIKCDPRNKINKLWEDSISTPKALGNESVAFRELRDKDKILLPSKRRISSTDRREHLLSIDEKFVDYPHWEVPVQLIDVDQFVCYASMSRSPDTKDPRLNTRKVRKDSEPYAGRHPTKYCRNISLELVRKTPIHEEESSPIDSSAISGNQLNDEKHDQDAKFPILRQPKEYPEAAMLGNIPGLDSECVPDCVSLPDPLPGQSKGKKAAAMWADVLQTSRQKDLELGHSAVPLDVKIGSCKNDTRSAMEDVWQLESHECQAVNAEMTFLLDTRIQNVEDSLIFNDPTKGLDLHRRQKLLSSGSLSDKVVRELQIEEYMRVIKEEVHQKRHELEIGMKTGSFSDDIIKDLKTEIDIRDIEYEKYNKDLEGLKRFYKSSVVEILPEMLRLSEEKSKFISSEGNMLFLTSPLKETDCKRLFSLREEINEYRRVVENPNSTTEDQQHATLRLGWLHGERKEALCQLCLNMYRSKENLIQRFLGKLAWCNKVEDVLRSRPGHKDLHSYIQDRSKHLANYICVLQNVQRLDNGIWVKAPERRLSRASIGDQNCRDHRRMSSQQDEASWLQSSTSYHSTEFNRRVHEDQGQSSTIDSDPRQFNQQTTPRGDAKHGCNASSELEPGELRDDGDSSSENGCVSSTIKARENDGTAHSEKDNLINVSENDWADIESKTSESKMDENIMGGHELYDPFEHISTEQCPQNDDEERAPLTMNSKITANGKSTTSDVQKGVSYKSVQVKPESDEQKPVGAINKSDKRMCVSETNKHFFVDDNTTLSESDGEMEPSLVIDMNFDDSSVKSGHEAVDSPALPDNVPSKVDHSSTKEDNDPKPGVVESPVVGKTSGDSNQTLNMHGSAENKSASVKLITDEDSDNSRMSSKHLSNLSFDSSDLQEDSKNSMDKQQKLPEHKDSGDKTLHPITTSNAMTLSDRFAAQVLEAKAPTTHDHSSIETSKCVASKGKEENISLSIEQPFEKNIQDEDMAVVDHGEQSVSERIGMVLKEIRYSIEKLQSTTSPSTSQDMSSHEASTDKLANPIDHGQNVYMDVCVTGSDLCLIESKDTDEQEADLFALESDESMVECNASTNIHQDVDWRSLVSPPQNVLGSDTPAFPTSAITPSGTKDQPGLYDGGKDVRNYTMLNNNNNTNSNCNNYNSNNSQVNKPSDSNYGCKVTGLGINNTASRTSVRSSYKASSSGSRATHTKWDQSSPKKQRFQLHPLSPRSCASNFTIQSSSMTSASAILAKAKLFKKTPSTPESSQTYSSYTVISQVNIPERNEPINDVSYWDMPTDSEIEMGDSNGSHRHHAHVRQQHGQQSLPRKSKYAEINRRRRCSKRTRRTSVVSHPHREQSSQSPDRLSQRITPRYSSINQSPTRSRSRSPVWDGHHSRTKSTSRSPERNSCMQRGRGKDFARGRRFNRGRGSHGSREFYPSRGRGFCNKWRGSRGDIQGPHSSQTESTLSSDIVNSISISDPTVRRILAGDAVLLQMLRDPEETARLASMLPHSEDRDTVFRLSSELQNGNFQMQPE